MIVMAAVLALPCVIPELLETQAFRSQTNVMVCEANANKTDAPLCLLDCLGQSGIQRELTPWEGCECRKRTLKGLSISGLQNTNKRFRIKDVVQACSSEMWYKSAVQIKVMISVLRERTGVFFFLCSIQAVSFFFSVYYAS